jgi:hypothetical protein
MIQDFGQKINGAAKDRWGKFRTALNSDVASVISLPLSKSFPEPKYEKLLSDGVDPWTVSFVRSLREAIDTKPRQRYKLQNWAALVDGLRGLAASAMDGVLTEEIWKEKLEAGSITVNNSLARKIELYQVMGHEHSLKDFSIERGYYSLFEGINYDPPKALFVLKDNKTRKTYFDENLDGVVQKVKDALNLKTDKPKASAKKTKFDIYRNRVTGEAYIAKKIGKEVVRVVSGFETVTAARTYRDEHYDEVLAKFDKMKTRPKYRAAENRDREGQDWRNGQDVTPDQFMEAFNFRGVQFGNYVEQDRRQQDLNNAYDAFMDLALVLECRPEDLSLGGELGLAFGARGKGGKDPASAHFEPDEFVINLTKTKGAGSLAHEWFHALDNMPMRGIASLAPFGTSSRPAPGKLSHETNLQIASLAGMMKQVIMETKISDRCRELDKYRSSPYFTLKFEIGARAFEAYIIDKLKDHGITNDYLANVEDQAVFEAMDKLCGFEESRYPYPTGEEMPEVRAAYDSLLAADSPLRKIIPYEDEAPQPLSPAENETKSDVEDDMDLGLA